MIHQIWRYCFHNIDNAKSYYEIAIGFHGWCNEPISYHWVVLIWILKGYYKKEEYSNRGQKVTSTNTVLRVTKTLDSGQETKVRYASSMGAWENLKNSHSRCISYLNHHMVGKYTCSTHNNLKGFPVEIFLCWEIIIILFSRNCPWRDIASCPDLRLFCHPFLGCTGLPFAPYKDQLIKLQTEFGEALISTPLRRRGY